MRKPTSACSILPPPMLVKAFARDYSKPKQGLGRHAEEFFAEFEAAHGISN